MDPIDEPRSRMEAARCASQFIESGPGRRTHGLRLVCENTSMPGGGDQITTLDVCQLCPLWTRRPERS